MFPYENNLYVISVKIFNNLFVKINYYFGCPMQRHIYRYLPLLYTDAY